MWSGHKTQSVGRLHGLWTFGAWDAAVVVTSRATDLYSSCPAFVAWILAHELAHALLAVREPDVAGLSFFVQENIRDAAPGMSFEWYELPHEDICDRYGRFVAESFLGQEHFYSEIRTLADGEGSPMGSARLSRLLNTPPLTELPSVLPTLREFVRPFARELRRIWSEDAQRGDKSYVAHLDPSILLPDS